MKNQFLIIQLIVLFFLCNGDIVALRSLMNQKETYVKVRIVNLNKIRTFVTM